MNFQGPLADSYPGAVVLVVLALTPYLILTSAFQPLQMLIGKDLPLGPSGLQLTSGMANAAYAFGTVLSLQLVVRLPVRRVLLASSSAFVIGSVLAAWSPLPGLFVTGHVLQGLSTGLMLIAAVPPLVIGWPKEKLPHTAAVMNLGIFGAVALGPVVGGVSAGEQSWRPFFWIVAGLGLVAFLFALLTYEDQEPQDPDAPIDLVAMVLGGGGCAAAFFGVSMLSGRHLVSAIVLVPALVGLAMIAALLVYEYRTPDPLIPVRKLASTLPVTGIVVAMTAGAGSIALIELAQMALKTRGATPTHAAMLFWPEVAGALVSAIVFGRIFFTRLVPVVGFAGLVLLCGAAAVLTGAPTGGDALVVIGSGLVGVGVGFSVSPALFAAGQSLRSPEIPRVFAMVELLRGVAAFLAAPLILHLAMTTGGSPPVGLRTGIWVTGGLVLLGTAVAALVFYAGAMKLRPPRADEWLAGDEPAYDSPPLFARFRG